jgi:hypothetical protein
MRTIVYSVYHWFFIADQGESRIATEVYCILKRYDLNYRHKYISGL